MKFLKICVLLIFLSLTAFESIQSQYYYYTGPEIDAESHVNSQLRAIVLNNGSINNFTFPSYGIYNGYAYGSSIDIWIGGIIDDDTLVSTGSVPGESGQWEFFPNYAPAGLIQDLSPNADEYQNLYYRPEIIYESEYSDTFRYNDFVPHSYHDRRKHKPLKVRVFQRSFSYLTTYADDFILLEFKIQNLNSKPINDMFVGFYYNGSVYVNRSYAKGGDAGDAQGLLETVRSEFPELGDDFIGAAWVADVNGRPANGAFNTMSLRHTMGLVPLKLPESATLKNYNWWVDLQNTDWSDIMKNWGPRRRGSFGFPLRLFNEEVGIPYTDEDRYYMMSFPERDFTTYYAGTDLRIRGWRDVPEFGEDIADGWREQNFLYSFGPFDLDPGQVETVVMALVMGRNFHTDPTAFHDLFNTTYPSTFLKTLDQQDLINNVRNARKLFDNPGVDTDNDGDSGKYFMRYDEFIGDSLKVYYEGDGVPDYALAKPPPPPELRVYSEDNKITIRWNGRGVEEYFDKFSSVRDFEGYRVYLSRSDRRSELMLLSSYDREDYNRYIWESSTQSYKLKEIPFSIDSLRLLYGNDFSPLDYTAFQPYVDDLGEKFYFTKVDNNQSDLSDINAIHKVYPDAVRDTSDVDDEGRMRYYEYEYIVDNLLATIPYYVSISTFDFGYPAKEMEPMESDPMDNLILAYAAGDDWADNDSPNGMNAYVYPNPYIADGSYRQLAFENRLTDKIPDRARAIYFANVPNKCRVSIYSLDGDLIKSIEHDVPEGNGDAHIVKWDVISRNVQTIESGLFYWVVESDLGKQIGKLVIIR